LHLRQKEKAKKLFIPNSLKKTEKAIQSELEKENFKVTFSITQYDVDKNTIKYVLTSKDGVEAVPAKAKEIVKKNLEKWKKVFTKLDKDSEGT
jgi:hypothetical protein